MRVPGLRSARRTARQVRNRLSQPPLILLYHRVINLDADPWGVCVSPGHFEEHLQVLRESRRAVSLDELIDAVDTGRAPRGAVAVTFDDGYRDNLEIARPLLERYDVPATWFLATGAVTGDRMYWWDELESLLVGRAEPVPSLELGDAGRIEGGTLHSIYEQLRPLAEEHQQAALARLRQLAGATSARRDSHRILTPEEIVESADHELIDIGSHTVTHPLLVARSAGQQREEMVRSKRFLEGLLERPVRGFAYPHGGQRDYSAESVRLVRESGYAHACAAFGGRVVSGGDRYQLPRINVGDWDGDQFSRRLSVGFGA